MDECKPLPVTAGAAGAAAAAAAAEECAMERAGGDQSRGSVASSSNSCRVRGSSFMEGPRYSQDHTDVDDTGP